MTKALYILLLTVFTTSCIESNKINKTEQPAKKTTVALSKIIRNGNSIKNYVLTGDDQWQIQSKLLVTGNNIQLDSSYFVMCDRLSKSEFIIYVSYMNKKIDSIQVEYLVKLKNGEKEIKREYFKSNPFVFSLPENYDLKHYHNIMIGIRSSDKFFNTEYGKNIPVMLLNLTDSLSIQKELND